MMTEEPHTPHTLEQLREKLNARRNLKGYGENCAVIEAEIKRMEAEQAANGASSQS